MSIQKDVAAIGKEKFKQVKSFLDDLEVQMALGKMEAKDAFEKEKKNLNRFIQAEKEALKTVEKEAYNHRSVLWKSFGKLEDVLNKPFSTTKRKFDKDKKETLQAIYELEAALKEAYGDVRPSIQELLDQVKGKLDSYRIQLALGSIEEEDKLATRKAELTEAINALRDRLGKDKESSSKVHSFVEEIGTSFEHFKKAFSDLL